MLIGQFSLNAVDTCLTAASKVRVLSVLDLSGYMGYVFTVAIPLPTSYELLFCTILL
jgi:hypothetical protein